MTARIFRIAVLAALPGAFLFAQQGKISGPVSGYVFDASAHVLRSILGIPGAALFGSPVDFGMSVTAVSVAPRGDTAFVTASDGTFHLFQIAAGAASEINVDGLSGAPDTVVFSPAGSAAALYTGGAVQVITGLPASPSVAGQVDLSALVNGGSHRRQFVTEALAPRPRKDLQTVSAPALALSDDGKFLLAAVNQSVELFGNFSDSGKLASLAGPAKVAFAPGSHDAAIGDFSGAGIVLYQDLGGAQTSRVLAASDDAIGAATDIAYSADGKQLLLSSASGQSVIAFDLAGGGRQTVSCNCSPSGLSRLGDLFRLNDLGHDPLWLLDASAPRILFVPAVSQ